MAKNGRLGPHTTVQLGKNSLHASTVRLPVPTETQTSVLIDGQVIPGHEVRFRPGMHQTLIDRARSNHGHALCLCRTPPLKLQLRARANKFHLAAWPDQGNLHAVVCPFYSEQSRYSGQGNVGPEGEGVFREIRYASALTHNGKIPTSERHRPAPESPNALRLWGLLHHLWESSGLNRWHPEWKRDWGFVRYTLLRSSSVTRINDELLSEMLYVPRVFVPKNKESIESGWKAFVQPLIDNHRGSAEVHSAFIIGVVRSLTPCEHGYLLRLQQHAHPILLPASLAANLVSNSRRGWSAANKLGSNGADAKVVAMLRVECSRSGLVVAADCVLMRVSKRFIPTSSFMEDQVADSLVEKDAEFVRPLSYSQKHGELPSFVLRVAGEQGLEITEMFCFAKGVAPHLREAAMTRSAELALSYGHDVWFWSLDTAAQIPQLPKLHKEGH